MYKAQKNCALQREFYTKADLGLVAFLCLLLLFGLCNRQQGEFVVIEGAEGSWRLPLFGPKERIEVRGPLGITEVFVGEGRAEIVSSPCSDQLCVGWGKITGTGQALICAPNLVAVRIVGKEGYHALTY